MLRVIRVFRRGEALAFTPGSPSDDPVAMVLVACRWETRPAVGDDGKLTIPRLGPGGITAGSLLSSARRRWFRLRVWYDAESRPSPSK